MTSPVVPSFHDKPLTLEEMNEYRSKAKVILNELDESAKTSSSSSSSSSAPPPPSWVRRRSSDNDINNNNNNNNNDENNTNTNWVLEDHRSDRCRYFDTHGFLILPAFCEPEMVESLKRQMADLANHDWDPSTSIDTFGTDPKSNMERGDYFLDSSNKVHYFAEPHALSSVDDEESKQQQQQQQQQLKPEFQNDKLAALNKAGHGMHTIPGSFRDYTMSTQMKDLVLELGWKDPVVPQSMYIFKQPKIGGSVNSHQDSSFLYTTPRQTCLGLWLALDDATLENGCLWVRPGSHREVVRRQFLRNPDYFETKDPSAPKLIFKQHHEEPKVTWEGELPPSLFEEGFVPAEVKAGDLVVFCGTLDHLSLPNFSDLQRHTFQLHLVEGPKESVEWSPSNWLQYPPEASFVKLIE
jgi:phytanoyl-CoA hydroxylase